MSSSPNSILKSPKIRVRCHGLFARNNFPGSPKNATSNNLPSHDEQVLKDRLAEQFSDVEILVDNSNEPADLTILDAKDLATAGVTKKSKIFIFNASFSMDDFLSLREEFSIVGLVPKAQDQHADDFIDIMKNAVISYIAFQEAWKPAELNFKQNIEKRKELELLNKELEREVFERTKYIEVSTQEQSVKLDSERSLIRLIKELSSILSVEDLLLLFRKEIRKFSYAGEPILIFTADGKKQSWLQVKNGSLNTTSGNLDIALLEQVQKVDFATPKFLGILANLFGRPVGRCLLIPLDLNLASNSFQSARAMICVELFFTGIESHEFFLFVKDRLEILGMTLDRILLEYQLSTYSYRWEKTFDGFRDAVAIVNSDFEVLRANRKFYFGEDSKEANTSTRSRPASSSVGLKCFQVFANRNSPCQHCPILEKSEAKGMTRIHVESKSYEVYRYAISDSKAPLKSATYVHQYVNVTEKERLNTQLLQNEKMSSLGMLAGHLAHELNNPLSGILTLTQVMLKQSEMQPVLSTGTVKADVSEIQNATLRSLSIIHNLIEFSKGGGSELVEVSIDELVEKTLPLVKTALRNHRFFKVLNAKNYMMKVEPQLIQQVIFNLIKNASQAMEAPGTIKVYSQKNEQGQVELVVEDSGPGIPEEHRDRIFEAFFTTKKKGEGTGLGLNLSKAIVERFHGKLSFKSTVGMGTQFVLCFPMVRIQT